MEIKDNCANKRERLLSCRWNLNSKKYQNSFSFYWRQNSIKVDIRSVCNPPGKDKTVYFDFNINGHHTLYRFGYNCYGGGHNGELPKIQDDEYKLNILAGPFSIEIFEEKIIENEKAISLKPVLDKYVYKEKSENYLNRLERQILEERKKEVWFSVSTDLRSTSRYEKPFEDNQLSFWINRTFSKQYAFDLLLYEYKLFTPLLMPLIMTGNGFICKSIFDEFTSTGDEVNSVISFLISDPKDICRRLNWGRWDMTDIARTFSFINSLKGYKNWGDYDSRKAL